MFKRINKKTEISIIKEKYECIINIITTYGKRV